MQASIKFGPLDHLLECETITDIMYHNDEVWIDDLNEGHCLSDVSINDREALVFANQLAQKMRLNFNATSPILDAETETLRINAIHPELSPNGVVFSIRKTPAKLRLTDEYLLETEYVTSPVLEMLKKCVRSRLNIIIAGETGAGKTELLKYFVQFIKDHERIITIEDTLESKLKTIYPHKDIVSLKVNQKFGYKDLIKTSLRQRPDWILVSETRGEEAEDLLASVASGHSIITTIHATSARDIPLRLKNMVKKNRSDVTGDLGMIHQYLDIGIYVRKVQKDGIRRKIVEVVEFVFEDGEIKTHTLYESINDEQVMNGLTDATKRKIYHKTDGCEYL